MPSTVQLSALSYSTPDGKPLLSNLDLTFPPGRTGIVGRNGSGKSTLVRLIAGALQPVQGTVSVSGRLALLRQADPPGASVADILGVTEQVLRLARIEAGTASDEDLADPDWSLAERCAGALTRMGLPPLELSRAADTLSGGQRMRLRLAALLVASADILVLDEPSNDLDAEGRAALVGLLAGWRGLAIVVSHDRALLSHMDRIVELTSLGASTYGGNYAAYAHQKALELAAAERRLSQAENTLAGLERDAQAARERQDRRDASGRSKSAKGDLPRILLGARKNAAQGTAGGLRRLAERRQADAGADLAAARADIEVLAPLSVDIAPSGLPAGATVLQLDRVSGGPDLVRPVIRELSLAITGPERVAVTGRNGAGKTSLLRLVTGALRTLAGTIRITPRHVLLDQGVALLDPQATIRDNYRRLNPTESENACHAALARFRFRAHAALQLVGTLSGGERLRAGLACAIGGGRPPDLVILDEPTNHLDLDAIAAVEAGLRAYDGALLVVSHDRDFLAAIGITREITMPGVADI